MPRKPPPKKITAWSFSRWETYNQCPRKAKLKFIDKIPTTPNEAMVRGRKVHEDAEKFVNGKLKRLPKDLQLFDDELKQLADLKKKKSSIAISLELQWAFKRDWSICNDWFSQSTWARVVLDCLVLNEREKRATVIDYKTGKIRDGYDLQLELYAAATFARFPHIEQVKTELWYIDQGEIIGGDEDTGEGVYAENQADGLIQDWTQRVKPMLVDQRFAPKPSNLCRWCDFSQSNGGPCEY